MTEFFPGVPTIKYEGPGSRNPFAFKSYNADEVIAGKRMADHLRFAVAYWHTFRGTGGDPFGSATMRRPWETGEDELEIAKTRLRAAFEFFSKLGAPFWCFHDRDIAPEAESLGETNRMLDEIVDLAKTLQNDTGVKLLWGTANLFSHPRYAHGASTSPDPAVFAHAAAQVKKAMDVTQHLGGENYVFWGGREGYEFLWNTNLKQESEQFARFLQLAVDYKKKINFQGTLLIEPKPKEPTAHQYDFDAATVISFLKTHGLDAQYKLNIEANHATLAGHTFEHDLAVASMHGMLGSIDANRGNLLLGWDTDQFPTDLYQTTFAMLIVLNQGGLGQGGLNFDAKVRRGSFDPEDLFHAHIGAMDAFAQGLRIAERIVRDKALAAPLVERYRRWRDPLGQRILGGQESLETLEAIALSQEAIQLDSGRQEALENIVNEYLLGHR